MQQDNLVSTFELEKILQYSNIDLVDPADGLLINAVHGVESFLHENIHIFFIRFDVNRLDVTFVHGFIANFTILQFFFVINFNS